MLVLRTCQRQILFLKNSLSFTTFVYITFIVVSKQPQSYHFPTQRFEIHMLIEVTLNGRTDVCMHLSMLLCR